MEMLGRYRLVRQLAQGGMAEIFVAKQVGPEGFERTAVIKRVLPGLATDAGFVQMFLDEARISAAFSHSNLVQVFDFGQAGDDYFIAMEYLHGHDLRSIDVRAKELGRKIPAPIAAIIVAAACDGLHYAHTLADDEGRPLGLVHRDVSPSNIFVTFQGGVKVLDFGIAKAKSRLGRTQPGVIKGKRTYMSPEQIGGEPLDARSDVFSLGLVLYELLTGERAVKGQNDVEAMRALLVETVPPPSLARPDLPRALDAIVGKALERERGRRYGSAAELRRALDGFLADYTYQSHSDQLQLFLKELFAGVVIAAEQEAATELATAPRPRTEELPKPAPVTAPAMPAPRRTNRAAWLALGLVPLAVAATALVARRADPPPSPPPAVAVVPPPVAAPVAPPVIEAPPAEKPRRSKPPERFGSLQVNCLPWCQIFVDGQDTHQVSPSGDIRLAAGRHRLKVLSPALGKQLERNVVISAGEQARESFKFP